MGENPTESIWRWSEWFFMKHKNEIALLDDVSATWIRLRSEALNKSATEIIGELVREKIAATP